MTAVAFGLKAQTLTGQGGLFSTGIGGGGAVISAQEEEARNRAMWDSIAALISAPDEESEPQDSVMVVPQSTTAAEAEVVDVNDDNAESVDEETPEPEEVKVIVKAPQYMQDAAYRSWRLSHPLPELPKGTRVRMRAARWLLDSLHMALVRTPLDHDDPSMRYLYDMRLPLISSGSVPADSLASLRDMVMEQEAEVASTDVPVSYFERMYEQQMDNEKQRHLVRFNFAAKDPRRFRFVRRPFDVPTSESRLLDSRSSIVQTRVADEIDVDFSNTDLESYWNDFDLRADKWHWKGDHSLTMQQTSISDNWYKGGESNMSVSGEQKITITRYDEEAKTTFESILDLKLSGYYTKADTIHNMRVVDNELSLNIKYGYKAWKKWYYSTQLYAKTPVFDFYKANSRNCTSTLFSPLEVNLSLGVDYQYVSPNKRFNYSLLLAPFSYDLKAVLDNRVDETLYGLTAGDFIQHRFGASLTTKFDWKMSDNVSWNTRLYYFTSYNSVKVEFENTLNFKISRFLTAKVYAYPRFDDTRDTKMELKEMLTVGFSYQW